MHFIASIVACFQLFNMSIPLLIATVFILDIVTAFSTPLQPQEPLTQDPDR